MSEGSLTKHVDWCIWLTNESQSIFLLGPNWHLENHLHRILGGKWAGRNAPNLRQNLHSVLMISFIFSAFFTSHLNMYGCSDFAANCLRIKLPSTVFSTRITDFVNIAIPYSLSILLHRTAYRWTNHKLAAYFWYVGHVAFRRLCMISVRGFVNEARWLVHLADQ